MPPGASETDPPRPPPRRLRIGLDAHAIGTRRTGNERFMANVVRELRRITDHELVLYFTDAEAAEGWRGLPATRVRLLRPAGPLVRIPLGLPLQALRDRLDVLFVQYTGPPVSPCPVVTVVHDVAFARHPEYFSRGERIWMRRTIPFTLRRAAGVVTVSEFSKREITAVYGIDPARVAVARNGVDPLFFDPTPRPSPLPGPFLLAIGNLQPRKNLVTLIRAYRALVRQRPSVAERLVVVGQPWLRADALAGEAADLVGEGRVVFTGYLPDEDVVGLLREATAFVYPSVYEGFGLPAVEAMAAGAPTLVGDIPVMREIAGDAAVRVPPADVAAWADALERVIGDPELRSELRRRGIERSAAFRWDRTAAVVLSSLEAAARGGRREPDRAAGSVG